MKFPNRPCTCTLSGQHSRAAPVDKGKGESAREHEPGRSVPAPHLLYGGMEESVPPPYN